MGLLNNHRILVTGVLTDDSLAFGIAKRALEEGATIALSGAGRGTSLTKRTARKLGDIGEVIELDVTDPAQIEAAAEELTSRFRTARRTGARHWLRAAVLPRQRHVHRALRGRRVAMNISTYSLAALVGAFRPLLAKSEAQGGASVIALDFDGSRAYPQYDWMGVMKAGLESLGRYLAREVGPDKIRVNMLAAGPVRTIAAKSIPGFSQFEDTWSREGATRLGRLRLQRRGRHGCRVALAAAARHDRVDRVRRRRLSLDGLSLLLARELGLVEVAVETALLE
jgi:enoyl ACP reductase